MSTLRIKWLGSQQAYIFQVDTGHVDFRGTFKST